MAAAADRRRALVLLSLGTACYAAFAFAWFSLPAFLPPIVADLGLSPTLAGVVAGAIPLTYVPISLASGVVVDRIGPGRAIGLGLLLVGTAHALRSLATGFPSLFLLSALMGVGGTGVTFGMPKLVSVVVPPDWRGRATSVYVVGVAAGTALAYPLGQPVLGAALGGWRGAFRVAGLVVVVMAIAWLLTVRSVGTGAVEATETAGSNLRADLRTVLTHRALGLLVVVGTVYLLAIHGSQAWLPTIMEARGLAPGAAAALATVFVVGRIAGVLAIPTLSDWLAVRRGVVAACGLLVAVGVGGLLLTGADVWLSGVTVFVAGVGLGGLAPMIRTLPIELPDIGPRLTGTATGLLFAVGEVGGFLGPVVLGASVDLSGSYEAGLAILAGAGLAVVLAGALLPPLGSAPAGD